VPADAGSEAGSDPIGGRGWPVRWLVAFGRFWWEFLIGDTPELFVGAVVVVGVVALVCTTAGLHAWGAVLLPVLVAAVLTLSVWRAVRASRPGAAPGPNDR
jgi:hypothetical protein